MIPGLPRGRLTIAVLLMGSVMLFMAGGVIGGNQAAMGEPSGVIRRRWVSHCRGTLSKSASR